MSFLGQLFGSGDLVLRIVPTHYLDLDRSNLAKITVSGDKKKIKVKESVTIGREGDIRLTGPAFVSRTHCRLIKGVGGWTLRVEGQNGMAVYIGIIKRLKQGEEIALRPDYGLMITTDMKANFIVE